MTPPAGAGIRAAKRFCAAESFAGGPASFPISAPQPAGRDERKTTMQRVTMVRYTAKPGRADENETLSKAVFAELERKPAQPFAYALLRDGDDFLHMFLNLAEDDASALTELSSFKAFSEGGAERWAAPPEILRLGMRLVATYGFEAARQPA
jgi:hypothetical protein